MQIIIVMMIRFFIILFFCLPVFANPESKLSNILNEMNSLTGNFKQKVLDQNGAVLQEVSGQFFFKKPNLFKWDYLKPSKSQLISDGELLYLYDPDLKQVVISQLKKLGGVSPAMLLVNPNIESLFEISVIQDKKGINWFKAEPKEPEKANFKEVFINFFQKELKDMRIIDTFDNVTEIEFIKVSRNININDAIFLFNTPEDIDVIKN
ncbi:outer membrane lipoprotein chaperone LolA [Methylophilaceae bacterium]|nr:outer membrane lipoprotein chaperone LolA [Methylophilaceae bacterium]